VLIIKYTLSCDNVCSVGTVYDDFCHDCDADMFLDVKGTGIEGPYTTEQAKPCGRKDSLEGFAERESQ